MGNFTFTQKREAPTVQPASAPIKGREDQMVKNLSGGYAFKASEKMLLERFLILGTTQNAYYANREKLTNDLLSPISLTIRERPVEVANTILEISDSNRATSNSPSIFLLAHMFASGKKASREASRIFSRVIRNGSQLFEFVNYVRSLRGDGRILRESVSDWMNGKEGLLYQVLKYQKRFDYSWLDLLRIYHPKPQGSNEQLFKYIAGKAESLPETEEFSQFHAVERAKVTESEEEFISLIKEARLSREMVTGLPLFSKAKKKALIALSESMPATALLRNLATLTASNALTDGLIEKVELLLLNKENLEKARINPMSVLKAWYTYKAGQGFRGNQTWTPNKKILSALEKGFENAVSLSKDNGKKNFVAIDVSGSMTYGGVQGFEQASAIDVAAAYAYILAKSCKNVKVLAFDYENSYWGRNKAGGRWDITGKIKSCKGLSEAIAIAKKFGGGGTDVSLPFKEMYESGKSYDLAVLFTDGESWAGGHAPEMLKKYRGDFNRDLKVVYCTVTPYGTTQTDPLDQNSIDIVGFDANAPSVIEEFSSGNL